jgi:TonB family protein
MAAMKLFSCRLFSLVIFIIPALVITASAQTATSSTTEWETLRPEGEEFSVLMPKGSTFETSKEPYHKMELSTRTYLSKSQTGPVFAVVSLSGIKSNPALYTEMQRMNSYVDAFKVLFSPKVRKDTVAKLALIGDKSLQGNSGREYRMTLGDLSGTAQVFATRKRFYSVVYLDTKKNEAIQEQFLSSFVLPEKTAAPTTASSQPPPVTTEDPAVAATDAAKPNAEKDAKPDEPARPTEPGKRGPVSAGVLNSKAINLPVPDYPAEAKAAGVEGVVVIQVIVDEQGNVTEARAISGPKILQDVSLNAARQAKFSPLLLSGEAVKVSGVLVFNFGRPLG